MGFEFSLATVALVRGMAEEREEQMLMRILQQIVQTLGSVAEIDARVAEMNAARRQNLFQASAGLHVHASYGELEQLKMSRVELEEQLRKLHEWRETQMRAYSAARRDRELLDGMRDEKRDAYETELGRREQAALDDNFMARRRVERRCA